MIIKYNINHYDNLYKDYETYKKTNNDIYIKKYYPRLESIGENPKNYFKAYDFFFNNMKGLKNNKDGQKERRYTYI